jgi:NAD(P)-dependent dehydrogenase (short-subunit alcohol dehydrogenase family)
VLVTGCSSGIGRAVAVELAKQGFIVFATVRKETDVETLCQLNLANLVPICPLDLSRPEHIPNAVVAIKKELSASGKEGLFAIVNNAGGGFISPVELMNLEKMRVEVETRLMGPIALVQALLPLVRKSHGRILWITTPALIAIPYVSSIHASEFAMNCIAQSLHLELTPWGIQNVMICCGGVKTGAPERTARELVESLRHWPQEHLELYSRSLQRVQGRLAKFDTGRSEPEDVAEVVSKALCTKKPRRKYFVGRGARAMSILRLMPQSVVDYIFSKMI